MLDVDINPGGPQGGSGGQYFVGTFDGTRFVSDDGADRVRWVDHGKDFYATISFSDLPAGRGPIWMGWISNWQYANEEPTATWRGAQSLPRKLSLRRTAEGWRLVQQPTGGLSGLMEPETAQAPDAQGRAAAAAERRHHVRGHGVPTRPRPGCACRTRPARRC